MDSSEYWNRKIIEWENSMLHEDKVSAVEALASKFRKPLKIRSDMCLDILKKSGNKKSILELGCGSGFFAFRMHQTLLPRKIIALDISSNAIKRANDMKKQLHIGNKIQFKEADASSFNMPKADITIGLGFLDYLSPEEIRTLFKNLKSKHFIFTFSEKKPSLLRSLHIIYLMIQNCPKHYYYTKDEILKFAGKNYRNVRIISDPKLSFGCIVHNLPIN